MPRATTWLVPCLLSLLPRAAAAQEAAKHAAALEPKLDRPVGTPLRARPLPTLPGERAGDTDLRPRAGVRAPGAVAWPPGVLHDQLGGTHWVSGQTYKASFDAAGATFIPNFGPRAPRDFGITFRVKTACVGVDALAVRAVTPEIRRDRITYRHGGVRVEYELRGRDVEQTLWFDALPERGDVRVEVDYATDLRAEYDGAGLVFANEYGRVTYGAAVAVDARGHKLPITTELRPGTLVFRVPSAFVADAVLPLGIDPLIGSDVLAYQQPPSNPVSRSDIAYVPGAGEYAVVFQRVFSATDIDVYAQRYDADLNPVGLEIIDTTTDSWELPRIAANEAARRFLVVAQVSTGLASPFWIGGRRLDAGTGLAGAPFVVERAGVAGGASGDKLAPSVGGDMNQVGPTGFAVAWERVWSTTDHDIHAKLVPAADGAPLGSLLLLDNTTSDERRPSLSKTDGNELVPATQCWGVTWQRTFGPSDEDIRGALLRHDGTVVVPSFSVDGSGDLSTHPSVSSPTDDRNGERLYLFAYQDDNRGGSIDVFGTLIDQTGAFRGRYSLGSSVNPGYHQYAPSVDSDGCRFVVGYHEWNQNTGANYDVWCATFAWEPTTANLRLHDLAAVSTTPDAEYDVRLTTTRGLGSGVGRYAACWTRVAASPSGASSVHAQLYDGTTAGGRIAFRSTRCGSGAPFNVFGEPLLGGWFSVAQQNGSNPRGWFVGQPVNTPLPACPGCTLGALGLALAADPLVLNVPCQSSLVGLTLALQAFQADGGPCLGVVSLSDTLDVTVR